MTAPPVRKASVRGPSTPYVHSLYEVFGSVQLAILWQQVDWLSEDYGDPDGWAYWHVSEMARVLGPRESTVRGWLEKLLSLGAIEQTPVNGHGQHGWRPIRSYVHGVNPRLSLRERRWDLFVGREGDLRESREPNPHHDRDRGSWSKRARPQDVDTDVDGENNGHKQQQQPRGSERLIEKHVVVKPEAVFPAARDKQCVICAETIKQGEGLVYADGSNRTPVHASCVEVREGAV